MKNIAVDSLNNQPTEDFNGKILTMDSINTKDKEKSVDLTEAVQIVQEYFKKICCRFTSFAIIGAINEPSLPYIAVRCKEHYLSESEFRVHDVIVSRNGSLYSTRLIGIEGEDELPEFTGR